MTEKENELIDLKNFGGSTKLQLELFWKFKLNIIIIINSASFLVSHRMKIVEALIENHYSVTVVCGSSPQQENNAMKNTSTAGS